MKRADAEILRDDRPQFNDWFWRVVADGDDFASGHEPTYLDAVQTASRYLTSLHHEA